MGFELGMVRHWCPTQWAPATDAIDSQRCVRSRPDQPVNDRQQRGDMMKDLSARFARLTLFSASLALVMSACTADDAVQGPKPVDAQSDAGDIDQPDEVTPPAATVGFHIEIAGGDALVAEVGHAPLTLDKDKNTTVKGFQVNVVIASENIADGTTVEVTVDDGDTRTTTITGNAARLDDVTLPCTPKQSNITVTAKPTAGSLDPVIKTFTLACGDQCVVELEQLTSCLTADQDPGTPGFQQPIKVTSKTPGCDTVWLEITDIDGATIENKDKATSLGQATEATLQATLATVDTDIFAKSATIIAHASDSQHEDHAAGESLPLVVKITTNKPEIANLQPAAGTLNLLNDVDKNAANGIDIDFTGTVAYLSQADVDAIVIEVGGQTYKTKLDVTDKFSQPLSFTKSGDYTVKVTATNGCLLVGSVEIKYSVFVEAATLTISKPLAKSVLLAKDDGDAATATVYDTNIEVSVGAGTDGATIGVWCRKNAADTVFGTEPAGSVKYSAGAASVQVPVKLDTAAVALGNDISCQARDDGPNPAQSAEVAFQVGLPAPCLKLSQPANGTATKDASLPVTTEATHLDGMKVTATLTKTGQPPIGPTAIGTVAAGGFSGALSLMVGTPPAMVPDGAYTLAIDALDAYGNKASDSACSDVSRQIVIDSTPPFVKMTAPTASTLDPLVHADVSEAPGYQTDVEVEILDELLGAVVNVCLSVGAFKVEPCLKTGASNKLKFSGVTLTSGQNKLVFVATDEVGNSVTTDPTLLALKDNAVKVAWIQPTQSLAIPSDSITVKVKVSDSDGNKPIAGASVKLYLDDAKLPYGNVTVSEGAAGVYTLVVSGLAPGANKLVVGVTPKDLTIEGFGQALIVTYKTSKPAIQIDAPKDGAVIIGTAADCLGGSADCVTDVQVSTTNVGDGGAVELSVLCGKGKPTLAQAEVTDSKATLKQVALKNNSKCVLSAKVTDEAGQPASATDVSVTVDRSAPVLGELKAPQFSPVLASADIDANPDNGMQTEVALIVGGLPASSKVTLKIYDDTGKLHSEPKPKTFQDIADGAQGVVSWGVLTLPDGKTVKLSFEAVDPVGNSAQKDIVIEVISNAAEVRMTGTIFVADTACSPSAPCATGVCAADGKCALPWNKKSATLQSVAVLGLPSGTDVRICSDDAAGAGAACATAGYKLVAQGKTQIGSASIDIGAVADGTYAFIAEVQQPSAGAGKPAAWISSLTSTQSTTKYRRITIDRVIPELVSCLAPQVKDVPAGCLSAASQTGLDNNPGGTFAFAVTSKAASDLVTIFDENNNKASAATAANMLAGVSIALPEGSAKLTAQAADLVGNVSAELSCGSHEVNTVAPTGKFVAPAGSPLLFADKDKLDVVINSLEKDVEGQAVTLLDAGKSIGSVAFKSGQVTFAHSLYKALEDGEHTLTALLLDTCGNSMTIGTVPSTVVVDTLPPTVNIDAPTQAVEFGDAQDADKALGGFQVEAVFGCGGASEWLLELGSDCDGAYANCVTTANIGGGAISNAGGNEPKQLVTIPFGQTTNYALRVTCTDTHGNKTKVERGFQVKLSGCLVALSGTPANGIINTAQCASPGVDCAGVEVTNKVEFVGPCGNITAVKLYQDDKEVQSEVPANSMASFKTTFKHGASFALEAKVLAGTDVKGASGPKAIVVDLANPKVAFVKTTLLGFETPVSGGTVLYAAADDQDAQKNNHQFHARLQVEDDALKGGKLTALVYDPGTGQTQSLGATGVVTPLTFAEASSTLIDLKFSSIPENATGQVKATAADAAGNQASATFTVTVDWVAPAKISVDALTDSDLNPRRPYAVLNFKAVADNGSAGKAATSYEVRYSRKAIDNDAAFDAACDAKTLSASTIGNPAAPGQDDKVMVEGPDGRGDGDPCQFAPLIDNGATKYYFAVRAVDAAGNKGPISDELSTGKLRLRFAKLSGAGDYAHTDYWRYVAAVGDVNGDGLKDVGVGGRAGEFCVVYGAAESDGSIKDIVVSAASAAGNTCIKADKALGLNVASPVDMNGDGIDDLVLSYGAKVSGDAAASMREIRVFLGEKGKAITTTPAVTVTNITNTSSRGVRALASAGNFTGDKSGAGNAISDIAFTTDKTVANAYERVMILPGSESWASASPIVIDSESASDRAKHNVGVVYRMDYVGSPKFGIKLAPAGNVLLDGGGQGQQYDDLLISQYATSTHIIVLKGQALSGETTFPLSAKNTGAGAGDAKTVRLYPHASGTNNFTSATAVSFDGDNISDIVALQATYNQQPWLYWIRGKDLQGKEGELVSLAGSAVEGNADLLKTSVGYKVKAWLNNVQNAANFTDNSGSPMSVVFGQRATWAPDGGQTWMPMRYGIKRAGATGDEASFHMLDVKLGDPLVPSSVGFTGYTLASVGDFNGDGYNDVIVATKTDYSVLIY